MRAIITTTAPSLIKAYGQRPTNVPGLLYSSFGRSGLLTADLETLFGVEQCGSCYWLDTHSGRRRVYPTEPICLLD